MKETGNKTEVALTDSPEFWSACARKNGTSETGALRSVRLLAMIPFAFLWLTLCATLSTEWTTNAQYQYGWLVPLLTLLMLRQRWLSRPDPNPVERWSGVMTGLVTFACIGYVGLRWLQEANPEWRLLYWAHALLATLATFAGIGMVGGSRWMNWFSFPIQLMWLAIPWPTGFENLVIQRLTGWVATLTAELANLAGIPALQRGNVLEIHSGILGIEEACSGIRSLQSAILVSFFLGGFLGLSASRRFALFWIGCGIAFVSNVGRTYWLVRAAHAGGIPEADRIHDTAAAVAMIGTLAAIFLSARMLERLGNGMGSPKPWNPETLGPEPRVEASRRALNLFQLSKVHSSILLVVLFGGWGLVELWYRLRETGLKRNPQIVLRVNTGESGSRNLMIPEKARAILRYSEGSAVSWQQSEGYQWKMFFLRWDPGRNSAQLARAHRPEICLTGTGGEIRKRFPRREVRVDDVMLPFDQYEFGFGSRTMHVFYCMWEDRQTGEELSQGMEDGSARSRVLAAWNGRRHLGQTVLELGLIGPASAEEARDSFERELPKWVKRVERAGAVAPGS